MLILQFSGVNVWFMQNISLDMPNDKQSLLYYLYCIRKVIHLLKHRFLKFSLCIIVSGYPIKIISFIL